MGDSVGGYKYSFEVLMMEYISSMRSGSHFLINSALNNVSLIVT